MPRVAAGTVMVTSPGVCPPDGVSWATDTCGVPRLDEPASPDVAPEGVTQSSVPNPSTSMSWFHASAGAIA